ncbi:MAG TPA: hypothetical protein VJP78_04155 [Thermoleophilia bacterium]|nr:hypothetical protein [Thermoleophilia bacterium]
MTEKISCDKCGNLLYFGEEISRRLYMRAVPDEKTVLGFYKDVCPRCGSSLSVDKVKIEIKGRNKHGA